MREIFAKHFMLSRLQGKDIDGLPIWRPRQMFARERELNFLKFSARYRPSVDGVRWPKLPFWAALGPSISNRRLNFDNRNSEHHSETMKMTANGYFCIIACFLVVFLWETCVLHKSKRMSLVNQWWCTQSIQVKCCQMKIHSPKLKWSNNWRKWFLHLNEPTTWRFLNGGVYTFTLENVITCTCFYFRNH